MEIKKLALENFRQFKTMEFEFSSGTSLILGSNTSGKTTLLEAIYLLSTTGSFRAERIKEMIKFNQEIARMKSLITASQSLMILELILTPGEVQAKKVPKRKFFINGVEKKRKEFIANLMVVLFQPEDIRVVTGSPTKRRDFLDQILVQADWEYRRSLFAYQKALRSRNKLLEQIREDRAKKSDLYFWSSSLAKNSEIIFNARRELIDFINHLWPAGLRIFYQQSLFISEKNLDQEIKMGMSLSGPHRDDFYLEKNEKNLSAFGSRSEQRLAILNLKLAELQFLTEKAGEAPVLLLDDVFSELDEDFREKVLGIISRQQTIVTAAEPELIKKKFLSKMKVIQL